MGKSLPDSLIHGVLEMVAHIVDGQRRARIAEGYRHTYGVKSH